MERGVGGRLALRDHGVEVHHAEELEGPGCLGGFGAELDLAEQELEVRGDDPTRALTVGRADRVAEARPQGGVSGGTRGGEGVERALTRAGGEDAVLDPDGQGSWLRGDRRPLVDDAQRELVPGRGFELRGAREQQLFDLRGVAQLGEDQEIGSLRLLDGDLATERDDELVTDGVAKLDEALDGSRELGLDLGGDVLGPPGLEHRALGDALTEQAVRVGHALRDVRDRGVHQGVRRREREQLGLVAQLRAPDLGLDLAADLDELLENREMLVELLAPGDLVGDRHAADRALRGGLLAAGQDGRVVAARDPDLTLDDRDAGPLRPCVDGEDGALDRNLAVVGGDGELAESPLLRGLDDHLASVELDPRRSGGAADGDLRARAQLDERAVFELEERAAVLRGAHDRAGGDHLARADHAAAGVVDGEQVTDRGLDAHVGGVGEHAAVPGDVADEDGGDERGGEAREAVHPAHPLGAGGARGALALASGARLHQCLAAGDALADVVVEEHGPLAAELAREVVGDQRFEVLAADEGCMTVRLAEGRLEVLENPLGRSFDALGVEGILADRRGDLIEQIVLGVVAGGHDSSPWSISRRVLRRFLTRCSVTPTAL